MAKKIKEVGDKVTTAAGSVSLTDLQSQIQTLAAEDKRFNTKAAGTAGNFGCGVWCADIEMDGEEWNAVIQAADSKMYQVSFTVASGKVTALGNDAVAVVRKTQYVSASYSGLFYNGVPVIKATAPITAADGHIEGKPSLANHVEKMRQAVSTAIATDQRFKTGKGPDGRTAMDWNKPYVADILVPDDDGQHHAVIRRDDGKLVKHAFDYDAEAGTATMDDGDSDDTECTPVYTKALAEYDAAEAVVRAGEANAPKTGTKSDRSKASQVADSKSDKADTTGEKGDHKDAAKVHREAAAMYSAHHEATNDDQSRRMHAYHTTAAEGHDDKAAEVAATTQGDPLQVVHCKGYGTALPDEKWSLEKPATFMWMPGGTTTVTASWNGKPITMTVECDEATAKTVQASFDRLRTAYPKQKPFGCVEHREEEASLNPEKFDWKDGDEPGVFCTALPTGLGVRNVNERIHRSWSPSFTTDAAYSKIKLDASGIAYFPDGVRGSAGNPARVTGVHFSVGSLTNKPAFKNIAPVKAKDTTGGTGTQPVVHTLETIFAILAKQASPPATNNGASTKRKTMKIVIIKAHGEYKQVGTEVDIPTDQAVVLLENQHAVTASEWQARQQTKAGDIGRIEAAVERGIKRGAIKPKDEAVKASSLKKYEDGKADVETICQLLDYMPGTTDRTLTERVTAGNADKGGEHVWGGDMTAQEACMSVVNCKMGDMLSRVNGASKETIMAATDLSRKNSALLKAYVQKDFDARGDYALRDMIRATISDVTDANSQVGTLSSTLILMRNLGFLKNKIDYMPYITTDLRNEPALFGQNILTRYITPPGVLTYVPGIGYTSDATAISAYIANLGTNKANVGPAATALGATASSGTQTFSVPGSTDVQVVINNNVGCEIVFPTSTLGATARNLFAEQQGAQLYSIAEIINKVFLATAFSATWSGLSAAALSLGANFGLPGIIKIKTKFTVNKMPDMGRFALLHTFYHDNILTDSNLLNAKAILALINKDASAFNSGELPPLFGVKILESQLAAYIAGTQTVLTSMLGLQTPTDPATLGNLTAVGFAGNSASMLLAARVPQDYTTVFKDVPATAAVEIVTEPDSGLSMMFVKYVNNTSASVYARGAIMFGIAQGDPRQGFLLAP